MGALASRSHPFRGLRCRRSGSSAPPCTRSGHLRPRRQRACRQRLQPIRAQEIPLVVSCAGSGQLMPPRVLAGRDCRCRVVPFAMLPWKETRTNAPHPLPSCISDHGAGRAAPPQALPSACPSDRRDTALLSFQICGACGRKREAAQGAGG